MDKDKNKREGGEVAPESQPAQGKRDQDTPFELSDLAKHLALLRSRRNMNKSEA